MIAICMMCQQIDDNQWFAFDVGQSLLLLSIVLLHDQHLRSSSELQVTLLQQQLEDMRQAATEAEQERDKLALTRRQQLPSRSSFGSLGPNTPKRGGGSLRGAAAFDDDSGTPAANGLHREHMDGVDIVYLKNVLLKFVDAHAHGRTQECSTLLPAIAALLRATPLEYRILKDTLERSEKTGNWWARAVS